MFQFAYSYFYTVIFFLYHLPYMDLYFNLPISKFINAYIYTNKDLFLFYWFLFYLLYLTRTTSVRLIEIKLHWYVLKMFYYH